MEAIPFFPKFVTYFPMVCAVFTFFISFSKKQYLSWEKTFGETNAAKVRLFMRYVAPPILILGGVVQFL
jgi:hypothetical protein